MDSFDKGATIVTAIGLICFAIIICGLCWMGVEKAKVEAQPCEQCKLIKKEKK